MLLLDGLCKTLHTFGIGNVELGIFDLGGGGAGFEVQVFAFARGGIEEQGLLKVGG